MNECSLLSWSGPPGTSGLRALARVIAAISGAGSTLEMWNHPGISEDSTAGPVGALSTPNT